MASNYQKGFYLAGAAAFISGISIFFNKFALEAVGNPLIFTTSKNVLVGVLIFSFILISGKLTLIKKLTGPQIVKLISIGIIGGSLPFYLFFTGLAEIPAINAAIIHKTLVFWVIILAIPFLKEKLSKLQLLAITLLFTGNIFIGGFKGFKFSEGELLIFLATILWAVENVIAKKVLAHVDSDLVTSARMGSGSLILISMTLFTNPSAINHVALFSQTQWMWIVFSAVLLLGYVATWYRALKFAPAIMVTAILVTATLITNILSAIFVTHVWTIERTLQAGLIIIGIAIFAYSSKITFLPRFGLKF